MTPPTLAAEPASVWDQLVGQCELAQQLRQAARAAVAHPNGTGSGHASWLFTGPPGSGRSVAARAFAAALECEQAAWPDGEPGCGRCAGCLRVSGGSSVDVRVVATQTLSHSVADMRQVVAQAARQPSVGRWQIIIVEDADRLTEQAANALLKAVEEPNAHTWWLLCAPTVDDVLPTIRSRCRLVRLGTPTTAEVAHVLMERDGVQPVIAHLVARASAGHVGQARWLARDEQARNAQAQAWTIPTRIDTVSDCVRVAAQVMQASQQQAQLVGQQQSQMQRHHLAQALGVPETSDRSVKVSREATAALREQERLMKSRAKRLQRDAIDRVLTELSRCYRDVLAHQWGARLGVMQPVDAAGDPVVAQAVAAAESGQRRVVEQVAQASTPAQTVQRLDAIMAAREAILANVAPQVAVEVLLLSLSPGAWLTGATTQERGRS